jgi:hypothetical protein
MGAGVMSGVVTASLLPDKVRRRHDEDDFQETVCRFLRWSLPGDAEYFAIPNGGFRHSKAAARLARTGVRAGVPDLCIVHHGNALFLELKTPRGQLSEAQRQMIRKLEYCGCRVLVCRTLACVETSLRELGVPLRGSVS